MIYPTSGISIFAHILVITAVKAKNFLGLKTTKKNSPPNKYFLFANKVLVSLTVAIIIESISFLVVGSSVAVIEVGFFSPKSNYNIMKNAYSSIINNTSVNLSYIRNK